jgi:hypothetical protein
VSMFVQLSGRYTFEAKLSIRLWQRTKLLYGKHITCEDAHRDTSYAGSYSAPIASYKHGPAGALFPVFA